MRVYDATQGTLITGKRYSGTPGQVPLIVHRFANEIVYAFTGVQGHLRDRDRLLGARRPREGDLHRGDGRPGPAEADEQPQLQPLSPLVPRRPLAVVHVLPHRRCPSSTCATPRPAWRRRSSGPATRRPPGDSRPTGTGSTTRSAGRATPTSGASGWSAAPRRRWWAGGGSRSPPRCRPTGSGSPSCPTAADRPQIYVKDDRVVRGDGAISSGRIRHVAVLVPRREPDRLHRPGGRAVRDLHGRAGRLRQPGGRFRARRRLRGPVLFAGRASLGLHLPKKGLFCAQNHLIGRSAGTDPGLRNRGCRITRVVPGTLTRPRAPTRPCSGKAGTIYV